MAGRPYMIFARPAGLAVYALAGLENTMTGQFVPYVMGVTRSVLASPGETTGGVDIIMDIPLDHTLETQLGALPDQVDGSPDRFYLQAYMDLGGEGVIVRNVNGVDFDSIRRRDMARDFTFVGEPALQGSLEDGRYRIIAGYTTEINVRTAFAVAKKVVFQNAELLSSVDLCDKLLNNVLPSNIVRRMIADPSKQSWTKSRRRRCSSCTPTACGRTRRKKRRASRRDFSSTR